MIVGQVFSSSSHCSPSEFYLVLDVANLTQQEVSLSYPNDKTILIEPKESCRVPVPVARCPLDQILIDYQQLQLTLSELRCCFKVEAIMT